MGHTSGDGAALLRAICDHPEEVTPRLAYADWLDEQGGESNTARAEFIRLQIAEEGKAPPRDFPHTRSRTAREAELLDKWGKVWDADLPKLPGIVWQNHQYERGFVHHITAGSVRSLLAAEAVFALAPVTWLTLDKLTTSTAKQLARSPVLARVREFTKFGLEVWEADSLAPLADTPHLCNLRAAYLWRAGLSADSVRGLLANRSLTRLTHLTLLDSEAAGTGTVSAILAGPSAPVLETITLQSCGIGPDAAPLLPDLVRLPKLRRLYLTSNRITDAAVTALAGVKLPRGKTLAVGLGYNSLTDRGAEALLKGEFLRAEGVRLHLSGNRITKPAQAKLTAAFGDRVGF